MTMFAFGRPSFGVGELTHGKGGGVAPADGWQFFGDSFAQSGSGGPGFYLQDQMEWYRSPLGLTGTITNNGVGGETSTQAKDRAIARTEQKKNLLFWAGRNDGIPSVSQAALVATLTANAQAVIDSAKPGQIVWLLAIHNFNYNAEFDADATTVKEGSGSARYNKIIAMNNALAALADGESVIYVDTRKLLVDHCVPANFQDGLDFAEDMPASSLTGVDGLHANAVGYNEIARTLVWEEYIRSDLYAARSNLVTDTGVAAWTMKDSATCDYADGEYDLAAVSAFGGIGQVIMASGATGKTFLLHWSMADVGGIMSLLGRPGVSGGSNFPTVDPFLNPFLYGYSAGAESAGLNMASRKVSRHQMIFVTANTATMTMLFQANNDASAAIKFSQPVAHDLTPPP